MTSDRLETDSTVAAVEPTVLPQAVLILVLLHLGALLFLTAFGSPSGGLFDIPISFFLKNKLNLTAHEVANFRLIAAIPLYLAFVFGFVRDTWDPLGLRDRGYMLLFGATSAVLYGLFAFIPITYGTLLVAVLLLTTSFLFVSSAQHGLTSV